MQGYPNLEYIIIDGGSCDNSVAIIKKYEPWLAYWVSEKDNGQSHAINKGWRKATGDILAYLNSDDTFREGSLYHIASYFLRHPDVEMVYGDVFLIDENGKIGSAAHPLDGQLDPRRTPDGMPLWPAAPAPSARRGSSR